MKINNSYRLTECEMSMCKHCKNGYCQCDTILLKREAFMQFICTNLKRKEGFEEY